MQKIIVRALSLVVASLLIFSVYTGNQQILDVMKVYFWILVILSAAIIPLSLLLAIIEPNALKAGAHNKSLTFDLFVSAVNASMLAIAGFSVLAVAYGVTYAGVVFTGSVLNAAAEESVNK